MGKCFVFLLIAYKMLDIFMAKKKNIYWGGVSPCHLFHMFDLKWWHGYTYD